VTGDTRRAVRTVLWGVVGLAAAMPLILDAAGISEASQIAAVALAVSGAVARVAALPQVDALLPSWLRKEHSGDDGSK